MIADAASSIFSGVWKLFLKTDFPGLGVSIAGVAISVLIIRFSIRMFRYLTGFGAGAGDYGRAANAAEKLKHDRDRAARGESHKFDW